LFALLSELKEKLEEKFIDEENFVLFYFGK
jgi:hypothetical protein